MFAGKIEPNEAIPGVTIKVARTHGDTTQFQKKGAGIAAQAQRSTVEPSQISGFRGDVPNFWQVVFNKFEWSLSS